MAARLGIFRIVRREPSPKPVIGVRGAAGPGDRPGDGDGNISAPIAFCVDPVRAVDTASPHRWCGERRLECARGQIGV